MRTKRESAVMERFALALDLSEAAQEITLERLRRKHPTATPEVLQQLLREWLLDKPIDLPGTYAGDPRRFGGLS
jgi:Rv0078B-related antitoxin